MYLSSAQSLADFIESNVWADMVSELQAWLKDIHETMEDPNDELSDRQHAKLRGNAEFARKFELLPHMIQENILDDTKQEEEFKDIEKESEEEDVTVDRTLNEGE